ncbi:anthranilate synthase component I family protein, partial [Petrachloros mirabilis]
MARFSQPSFLNGPPKPLILTLEGRSQSPLELYKKIASPAQTSFLLESGRRFSGRDYYTFLGSNPVSLLSIKHDSLNGTSYDPFQPLRRIISNSKITRSPDLPPFFGGAVGYFSYDFIRRLETLPSLAKNDLSLPEMHFALFEVVTAINHSTNQVQIIFCPSNERFLGEPRDKLYREGLDRLAECEARITRTACPEPPASSIEPISFSPDQTRKAYLNRVRRCQEYIAAGDIYQANLSHRFTIHIPDRYRTGMERLHYEQSLYGQLRAVNPSPFGGLLHFQDLSLVSCSPERLIRLQGRLADTRPIAGTRPRGLDVADDQRLVGELKTSVKEQAEHVMLVDLERNDLGRVCEFGSVHVDEFMAIEQYSHV